MRLRAAAQDPAPAKFGIAEVSARDAAFRRLPASAASRPQGQANATSICRAT